jgi:hypothetical protein
LSALAFLTPSAALTQTAGSEAADYSMTLQNADAPFVSADFAKQLGILVMQQKYAGFAFTSSSPILLDKGETWWVTFTIKDWPKEMSHLRPSLAGSLTLWIRKKDAAILAIR